MSPLPSLPQLGLVINASDLVELLGDQQPIVREGKQ